MAKKTKESVQISKNLEQKNLALGGLLFALVAILFFIAIIRF